MQQSPDTPVIKHLPSSLKAGLASGSLSLSDLKRARKKDAMALAELIYDVYKDELKAGKLDNGQNHAKQTDKT